MGHYRKPRPARPPGAVEPETTGQYVVVGKAAIKGVKKGGLVELRASHAARLMRGGHVAPAPSGQDQEPPEVDPAPDVGEPAEADSPPEGPKSRARKKTTGKQPDTQADQAESTEGDA
jgi:hypothetical protein